MRISEFAALPDTERVTKALASLDVFAVIETRHHETTELATHLIASPDQLERADTLGWVEPELTETPGLRIEGGRHPVVERFITDAFVPNDVSFEDRRAAPPLFSLDWASA